MTSMPPSVEIRGYTITEITMFRVLAVCAGLLTTTLALGQSREEKVRADRDKVESDGFWIYNDLQQAFQQARDENKPIIVVLRCIPCEECVKLDDDLMDNDPLVRPLLEKFVRARQVSTNGLDLDLFQYDTDQSFAVFFLNADGTIYGRFGTRSHRTEWLGDVSLRGLAKAMQGALDLHANLGNVRASLAGKRGAPMEVSSPEKFPRLKDKYTDKLNYEGNVVRSCIHCHQIGEAQRDWYADLGEPIPERVFFPYPHPKVIGLTLDAEETAVVKQVAPGSAAENSDLRPGDVIEELDGQPLLSIADVQWVLHNAGADGDSLPMKVRRGDGVRDVSLELEPGWRRADDISWRVSSWSYRRMVTGGMVLEAVSDEVRRELNLEDDQMALEAKYLGQHGPHGAAKRVGFRKGDLVVEFNGRKDLITESTLLHYAMANRQVGDDVDVTVLRDGRRQQLTMPMQE